MPNWIDSIFPILVVVSTVGENIENSFDQKLCMEVLTCSNVRTFVENFERTKERYRDSMYAPMNPYCKGEHKSISAE